MATIYGDDTDEVLNGVAGETNLIFGRGGDDIITGSDFQDLLAVNQGSRFGGLGGDSLLGGAGNDIIYGGGGDDLIYGDSGSFSDDSGDDQLYGGDGNDFLRGGPGVDYFDGGDGFDRISLFQLNATEAAVASLKDGVIYNDGFGNTEYFVSIEGLGLGTPFADTFEGDNGENYFLVGIGDTLEALGGDDFIQLSGAPALIDGGSGTDTITTFLTDITVGDLDGDGFPDTLTATSGVIVDLSLKSGQIVDDGFGNSGDLVKVENIGGSILDDIITGDNKANELTGLAGADILTGGKGRDVFVYIDAGDSTVDPAGQDTITDFDDKKDAIDLSDLEDEIAGGGTLSFAAGGFTGTAGEVTVSSGGGSSLVEVDLDGDSLADFAINVAGDTPLESNFIF